MHTAFVVVGVVVVALLGVSFVKKPGKANHDPVTHVWKKIQNLGE